MSTPALRKICVVGVGAIGGLFTAWLGARVPGIELSALARGETLNALRQQGLCWEDETGAAQSVTLMASNDPAHLGVQDLVIVCVKGPSLQAVAPSVRALMGPDTVVLVAMNGLPWWFFNGLGGACSGLPLQSVDPGGLIAGQISSAQVIGCVVHASATAPAPGRVARIKNRQLIIGEPAGGATPRLQALEAVLNQAGFETRVSERIQRDIWFKLWGNMTMNPISALTGATCDRILDDPLVRGLVSAIMLEAQEIGARIGIPIDQRPEERHALTRKLGAFKTSMLQDVEAARPLELDALLGAVREIGVHLGAATPHMDALMGLTRLMAQTRGLYPAAAPEVFTPE